MGSNSSHSVFSKGSDKDPFKKLPAELRLDILDYLETFSMIKTAALAVPALNDAYTIKKAEYCRPFVRRNLPEDMLQDALAIVHFPRGTTGNEFGYASCVDVHLRTWGEHMFADPCADETLDGNVMEALNVLYDRLWLHVSDCIRKARCMSLLLATRHLPVWSHHKYAHVFYDREHAFNLRLPKFDIEFLEEENRLLIFRSFLQYELLCKIYGPRSDAPPKTALLKPPRLNGPAPPARDVSPDMFTEWDWKVLFRYGGDAEPRHHLVSTERLWSVREYIITLYGAMIDRELPLPWRPLRDGLDYLAYEHGKVCICDEFPMPIDNHSTSGTARWLARMEKIQTQVCRKGRMGELPRHEWTKILPNFLASGGFDLLSTSLQSHPHDHRCFLEDLFSEFENKPPLKDSIESTRPSKDNYENIEPVIRTWVPEFRVRINLQRARTLIGRSTHMVTLARPFYDSDPDHVHLDRPHFLLLVWVCHAGGRIQYNALKSMMAPFWASGCEYRATVT